MSEDKFQIKRGNTAKVNAYVPILGEPVYDYTLKRLRLGDGVTAGGASLTLDPNTALTGVPTTPTAAADTNTTQVASTAFVIGQAGSTNPLVNGTVAVGTSLRYARQDHVHPVDTSRAPLASPSFTGVPLSTTPAVGTNTTQIATAAMVQAEIANKRAWTTYTPTVTPTSGTFTSASATGKYMVAFGICHIQVAITITTKGTGTQPQFTLPLPALSGSDGYVLPTREVVINGKTGSSGINPSLTSAFTIAYDGTDLASGNGAVIKVSGSYPVA